MYKALRIGWQIAPVATLIEWEVIMGGKWLYDMVTATGKVGTFAAWGKVVMGGKCGSCRRFPKECDI